MALLIRIAATALLMLGVPASVAGASFPGGNGKLAVTLEGCGDFTFYIGAFDVDGRELGPLTPPCDPLPGADPELEAKRSTYAPQWFRDGMRLLYVDDAAQLMTVTADGADPRPFLSRPVVDADTRYPIPLPNGASPAPNGRRVAFDYGGSIGLASAPPTKVTTLLRARRCRDGGACFGHRSPRWSPDGRAIAFESFEVIDGAARRFPLAQGIWLINARSGKLIRRVAPHGVDVDWAPDGRHLVYGTRYFHEDARGASGGNLYVVRRDGTHRRLLVRRNRLAEIEPTWSPDGRWIAWVSLRIGAGDLSFSVRPSLWRIRASGGRPQLIAKLPKLTVEEGDFREPQLAWQPLPREPARSR